jgi:FkbM family methyltransferase
VLQGLNFPRTIVDAWRGETVRLGGANVHVPGSRRIRLSVVAGNLKIHRLLDRFVRPGYTVVDVGANIGYNTLHAARLAGAGGRVIAVEPTPDNLEVLRHNIQAAGLGNVTVQPVAAGRSPETRRLFVRGARSAVNSLFAESCYASVTDVLHVPVVRLDELVDGTADVVKIDVEGAELDVLGGMTRLMRARPKALIVEWHPKLQTMAGYAPEDLPRWLLDRGWRLQAAAHTAIRSLTEGDVAHVAERLLRLERSIELLAQPTAQ